jgi:hypothetical protein
MGALLIGVLLVSFGLGYFMADVFRGFQAKSQPEKPVVQVQPQTIKVNENTPTIFEKEYLRSDKVVIADFDDPAGLLGLTVEEIKQKYTAENGFRVTYNEGRLLIHQVVNDWTPEDKIKCRLKSYKGYIAIYQGPDQENDTLLRVTAIRIETLPSRIQEAIQTGKYEFANEAELNDALENLDEYLP